MPLKKGKSKKVIAANIKELETSKAGKSRNKAIHTIATKNGMTYEEAKKLQARTIALSQAGKLTKQKSKKTGKGGGMKGVMSAKDINMIKRGIKSVKDMQYGKGGCGKGAGKKKIKKVKKSK